MRSIKLAVLVSGSGTTLENIFEKCALRAISANVGVVVASRADAYGLERARRRHVPTHTVERKKFPNCDAFSAAIYDALEPYAPDLICLAGFMCMLRVPERYTNRIMNIHPALLPSFGGKGLYGQHVHEAVLAHGCKLSGCTAHFVDNQYDHGPIIAQKAVPVLPQDTPEALAERVQAAEREIFPEAIQLFAEKRLSVEGSRVMILPPRE